MPVEDIPGSDFQQLSALRQSFYQTEFSCRDWKTFAFFTVTADFQLGFAAAGTRQIQFPVFRFTDAVHPEGFRSRSEFHVSGRSESGSGSAPAIEVIQDPRPASGAEIALEFGSIEFVQRNGQFGAPAVFRMSDCRLRFAVPAGFFVQFIVDHAVAVDQIMISVFFIRHQEKFKHIIFPEIGIAVPVIFPLARRGRSKTDMQVCIIMPHCGGQAAIRCRTDRQQQDFRRLCPNRIGKRTVSAAFLFQLRNGQKVDPVHFDRRNDFLILCPDLIRSQSGIPDGDPVERGRMSCVDILVFDPAIGPDIDTPVLRRGGQFHRNREFFCWCRRRNTPAADEKRRLAGRFSVNIQIHRFTGPGHGDLMIFAAGPVRSIQPGLDLRTEIFLSLIRNIIFDIRRDVIRPGLRDPDIETGLHRKEERLVIRTRNIPVGGRDPEDHRALFRVEIAGHRITQLLLIAQI